MEFNFFEFMFSSFWTWLGMTVLILMPVEAVVKIISRLIRRSMVMKHGWPPAHLDADGDWKKEGKNEQA